MSEVSQRLLGFALVAGGVFAGAYTLGERLPGHSHAHVHAMDTRGYQLSPEPNGMYTVRGVDGAAVTRFDEQHGALVHLIAVRPDFSTMSHTHPQPSASGEIRLDLPDAGPWLVYAEGLPTGRPDIAVATTTVGLDLPYTTIPLAAPAETATTNVGGQTITVHRHAWTFTVDGQTHSLEPYLGQPAHLVILRTTDGTYAHLHPQSSDHHSFTFDGSAVGPGTYRAFLQFGYSGEVLTFPYTIVL